MVKQEFLLNGNMLLRNTNKTLSFAHTVVSPEVSITDPVQFEYHQRGFFGWLPVQESLDGQISYRERGWQLGFRKQGLRRCRQCSQTQTAKSTPRDHKFFSLKKCVEGD